MLIDDLYPVYVGGRNFNHYKELGYNPQRNIPLYVKPNELTLGSHVKVKCICDNCGSLFEREYKIYYKSKTSDGMDLCYNCKTIKTKNTLLSKFGVNNVMQIPSVKEKHSKAMNDPNLIRLQKELRELSNLKKYGVSNPMKCPEIASKVSYAMKHKTTEEKSEIVKKRIITLNKNQTQRTSKQQLLIYNMVKEIFKNCDVILNYPCSTLSLDIMLSINNAKIDIEYDGWYWHYNRGQQDFARDYIVKEYGYKVLRIKSRRDLPSKEQLEVAIYKLLYSTRSFTQIKLNDWGC